MAGLCVKDGLVIGASVERVFRALTVADELAQWWPKSAESEPRAGGRLVFHWFGGSSIATRFDEFIPGERLAFKFGPEYLTFLLEERAAAGATCVRVIHDEIAEGTDVEHVVHIAQSWRFLLCSLKAYLEREWDLRPALVGSRGREVRSRWGLLLFGAWSTCNWCLERETVWVGLESLAFGICEDRGGDVRLVYKFSFARRVACFFCLTSIWVGNLGFGFRFDFVLG